MRTGLVRVTDALPLVRQVLLAQEYWRVQGLRADDGRHEREGQQQYETRSLHLHTPPGELHYRGDTRSTCKTRVV
jgi:hypothetical protein